MSTEQQHDALLVDVRDISAVCQARRGCRSRRRRRRRRHHRSHRRVSARQGRQTRDRARTRSLRRDRHGTYQRAPDDGDRHAPQRAGETVRTHPRAGGVGRGARRHRHDRRHRSRARHRRGLRVGRRVPARAARRRRGEQPDVSRPTPTLAGELGFDAEYLESVPLVEPAGRSLRRIRRAFIRASISRASRRRSWRSGAESTSTRRPTNSATTRARVKVDRTYGDVRGRRHRHAQSAGRLRRHGGRHAVSNEAGAVHQLRDCRACRARRRARRAVVGHG